MNKEQGEELHNQTDVLTRIEAKVDLVVARVSKLEAKSSLWGAVGGFLAIMATKLAGCM